MIQLFAFQLLKDPDDERIAKDVDATSYPCTGSRDGPCGERPAVGGRKHLCGVDFEDAVAEAFAGERTRRRSDRVPRD
jgi:hypothetical protein